MTSPAATAQDSSERSISVVVAAPAMHFTLQRHADGLYACADCSEACVDGLQLARAARPADWVRQWFNRVLPTDLPGIVFAIETAALNRRPLQLQWSHHIPGQGIQSLQLRSGEPQPLADRSQLWRCQVQATF